MYKTVCQKVSLDFDCDVPTKFLTSQVFTLIYTCSVGQLKKPSVVTNDYLNFSGRKMKNV